jgi:biopolymer transport protein ExbD
MAATSGNAKGLAADINVAPMIDVLLVLLIIFMVIVPAVPRGESALIPQASNKSTAGDPVVLEVLRAGGNSTVLRINQQAVAESDLQSRLAAVYANRAQRVLFVKGDDRLAFTEIAKVIDIGHAAGADQIGLMTPGDAAGR